MALLWIDGFEGYGTTGTQSGLDSRYTVSNTTYFGIFAGRSTGYSIGYTNDGAATITTPILYTNKSNKTTDSTLIMGCAVYIADSSGYCVMRFNDNATAGISVTVSGTTQLTLTVKTGSTTIHTYNGPAITFGFWYYVEMKVFCDDTIGTIEVRLNGTTVVSLTDIDTKAGIDAWHNNVSIVQYHAREDDLYICDGSGTSANDFQGVCKVYALYPVADTSTVQWTPSTGLTHWNLVDENPAVTTDYVSTNIQNKLDLYNYPAIPTTNQIIGVQLATRAQVVSGSSVTIESPIVSNSIMDIGNDSRVLSTTWVDCRHVSEADPNTGEPWTADGLAAAQFGIRTI